MDRENMDLFLARLKAMEILDDSPKEENEKLWEQRLEADIQKLKTFRFIRHSFFEGQFSMVFPDILRETAKMLQSLVFYSLEERIALSLRLADNCKTFEWEKLKTDYIAKMQASRQQTQIDEDGVVDSEVGSIYYFLASHAMPGEKQYDFMVLFPLDKKIVIMDFSFHEMGMLLWKTMLRKLITTIR